MSILKQLIIILCMTGYSLMAQQNSFADIMKSGKEAYKNANYSLAIKLFNKAIALQAQNSEAHYFLGYSLSRTNSADANGIPKSSTELTIKSSLEFEKINQLTPFYSGEYLSLDPYTKISSEWGSAALKYLYLNKKDSAIWALKQGKGRGGFGDFIIKHHKMQMDLCSQNAFLFTSGDNETYYLLYLQLVINHRADLKIINPSLLETYWYPKMLTQAFNIQFDKSQRDIDSTTWIAWRDTIVKIGNFKWTIKPSYGNAYLLRKDILMLSIFKKNNLLNEVNFSNGYPTTFELSLGTLCQKNYLIYRLRNIKPARNFDKTLSESTKYLETLISLNKNSYFDQLYYDILRLEVLKYVEDEKKYGVKSNAKKLMLLYVSYFEKSEVPYLFNSTKLYHDLAATNLLGP
jgi:hypothetical protein